jgi:hypothetical protein
LSVPAPGSVTAAKPVLLFGISGATWTMLDPMLRAGELPALASLCEHGARGILVSKPASGDRYPRPQTAWATIATGCIPARHGVTRFYHEGPDLREQPIWTFYAERGLRVGIFGWPGTWPPPAVAGFVVPSHLGRDERTWPPDLRWIRSIEQRYQTRERSGGSGFRVTCAAREAAAYIGATDAPIRSTARLARLVALTATAPREKRALLLRFARLDMTASVFAALRRRYRPHFSAYVTFLVDFASHRYWRYMDDDARAPDAGRRGLTRAVREAYVRTDRALGRVLGTIPDDTTVFVLSEHGMEPEPESAEIGETRYLLDGRAIAVLAGLPLDVAVRPIARWIAFRAPTGRLEADTAARLERLHVAETGLPLLAVHPNGASEVVVRLSLSRDVARYRKGDLDRLTVINDDRRVPFLGVVRPAGSARSAMHSQEAVFICRGPCIRSGVDVGRGMLVDILPTMLRVAGLECPPGLDGRVLQEIFVG